jgi:hypothetical protein
MGFTHTKHEPCLYYKHHHTLGLILLLQQVNDFIIGTKTMELCLTIKQQIQDNIPMRNDSTYQATLELSYSPDNVKEEQELETQMGFSYRQAIG